MKKQILTFLVTVASIVLFGQQPALAQRSKSLHLAIIDEASAAREVQFRCKLARGEFAAALHYQVNVIESATSPSRVDYERRALLQYELGEFRLAAQSYEMHLARYLEKNPRPSDDRRSSMEVTQLLIESRLTGATVNWSALTERYPQAALPEHMIKAAGSTALRSYRFSFAQAARNELARLRKDRHLKDFDTSLRFWLGKQEQFLRGEIEKPY